MRLPPNEYAHLDWAPLYGCSPVSEACVNCVAQDRVCRDEERRATNPPDCVTTAEGKWNGRIRLNEVRLELPLAGELPRLYWVAYDSDIFHEDVPDEYVAGMFAIMAAAHQKGRKFYVLTKRVAEASAWFNWVENLSDSIADDCILEALDYVSLPSEDFWPGWPLPNVALSTTAENQARLEERWPHIITCPAAVHGLSVEPMLGPLDLSVLEAPPDWLVVGPEVGAGARETNPDWVLDLINQCRELRVKAFVKDIPGWEPGFALPREIPWACEGQPCPEECSG